jgi:hypothetical protein
MEKSGKNQEKSGKNQGQTTFASAALALPATGKINPGLSPFRPV